MASVSIYVRDYRKEIPGELSQDRTVWTFPVVEGKTSHGKGTVWKIYVRLFRAREGVLLPGDGDFVEIRDEYFDSGPMDPDICGWINVDSGQVGGKIKKSTPTVVRAGKNLGKSSATNVWTQSLRDAYGLYNKQRTKASGAVAACATVELYPPMLAQILKDLKVRPKIDEGHPWYVQRKYNGTRTVATLDCAGGPDVDVRDCKVIMYSRRKKLAPGFSYIKEELAPVLRMYWEEGRRLYLDGEIYKHGVALQDISGAFRREDQPGDVRYDYMIYDCFVANEPELTYAQRKKILDDIFAEFEFAHAKGVETFEVYSEGEAVELYNSFLDEKFEGAMVRMPDERYMYSYNEYHSRALLKMKPTYDHEYVVVGWETGEKGKASEALMIVCQTVDGVRFPVTPAMEIPDRVALAKKMATKEPNGKTHFENHWLNRKLIVYYDELSTKNVPQRARTKMEIREMM